MFGNWNLTRPKWWGKSIWGFPHQSKSSIIHREGSYQSCWSNSGLKNKLIVTLSTKKYLNIPKNIITLNSNHWVRMQKYKKLPPFLIWIWSLTSPFAKATRLQYVFPDWLAIRLSDGSGSKIFELGWVNQPSLILGLGLENFPKNPKFFSLR